MAVLVTGATGRLGEAVVARLLDTGHEVRALTRRPFRAHSRFGGRVSVHEWHPLSEAVPDEAMAGVTGIVHLMGAPLAGGPVRDRAELVRSSRCASTQRLIEAMGGRNIRLIVTSVALPPRPAAALADSAAGDIARPDLPWEADAAAGAAAGASVAIVRLGLIAAPGGPISALVSLAASGLKLDLARARIPAIDANDAAAMLAGLLAKPDMTGLFLGVAPEPARGDAVVDALQKAARFRSPVAISAPRWLVVRRLGLLASLIQTETALSPGRLLAAGAHFTTPDPTPALVRAIETTIAARRAVASEIHHDSTAGASRAADAAPERP
ncbi:MAG: NAD-dependent epimerase/dehydratase family protein [Hyphomicrobiaceae bacterium]|nr:NAD-dependent epimerase/dehydratase family protein [Hyphomicrobiaceae bacterium]